MKLVKYIHIIYQNIHIMYLSLIISFLNKKTKNLFFDFLNIGHFKIWNLHSLIKNGLQMCIHTQVEYKVDFNFLWHVFIMTWLGFSWDNCTLELLPICLNWESQIGFHWSWANENYLFPLLLISPRIIEQYVNFTARKPIEIFF